MFFSRRAGHRFVDRGVIAAYDFSVGDLTLDGGWQELDLSSIVGVGSHLVLLGVMATASSTTNRFELKVRDVTFSYNVSNLYIQAVAVYNAADMWVWTNTSGKIFYRGTSGNWTTVDIAVRGHFK